MSSDGKPSPVVAHVERNPMGLSGLCERWYKSPLALIVVFCGCLIGVSSVWIVNVHVSGSAESEISVEAVRLLFVSDAPESAVVHGSLLFSVTPSVFVEFGGDVKSMSITADNSDIIYCG